MNLFAFFSECSPVSNKCQSGIWFIPVSVLTKKKKKKCLNQHVSAHLMEHHPENTLENNRSALAQSAKMKYHRFGHLGNRNLFFLTVLEARNLRIECQHGKGSPLALEKASIIVCSCDFSCEWEKSMPVSTLMSLQSLPVGRQTSRGPQLHGRIYPHDFQSPTFKCRQVKN